VGSVAFSHVRQLVVSFAALLMVVLAIQTPLEQAHQLADRAQAASLSAQTPGLEAAASAATVSARAMLVEDHASSAPQSSEGAASGAHHHHADGPLSGHDAGATGPGSAMTSAAQFQLENDHRVGLGANPQDRPPRPRLEPIA